MEVIMKKQKGIISLLTIAIIGIIAGVIVTLPVASGTGIYIGYQIQEYTNKQ